MEEITVGMGKYEIKKEDTLLVCVGIGSCISTVIMDSQNKVYGMAHVMLPNYNPSINTTNPNRYANVCIPNMIKDMIALGAKKENLKAKIAGGAHMFATFVPDKESINLKNIRAVKEVLQEETIPILAEDIGGNAGRTIKFNVDIEEFKIIIRANNEEKTI